MKKSLIAAAVVGAFAAPAAMAQNVSMYGTFDSAYKVTDSGGASAGNLASGTISTSVIGFKGTEDLGGGLKVMFDLQGSLGANTGEVGTSQAVTVSMSTAGAVTSTGTAGNSEIFNREAWIGLSGAFGTVKLGKTDVAGTQGIDGLASALGNLNDMSSSIGKDQDNVVQYTTPTMNGLTAQVGFVNTASGTTSGASDITSYMVSYAAGPLKAAVGQSTQNGSTVDNKEVQAAAQYDFGVAKVGVATQRISGTSDKKENLVGVWVPLGNGLELGASYAKETGNGNIKESGIALTKAMSKRTSVYAGYHATSGDTDVKATVIGIIHKF
jgi:predicted porin